MAGICLQDTTRPNPEEPVLSYMYNGMNKDQTELLSLRWDIPNDPLRNNLLFIKSQLLIKDLDFKFTFKINSL